MQYPKVNWDNVDWRMSNSLLAIELGVTRQAVYYQRKYRKEQNPVTQKPNNKITKLRNRQLGQMDLTALNIREVASRLNTSVGNAKSLLRYRGLKAKPMSGKLSRPHLWKYPWDEVDWAMRNVDIAEELGTTGYVVGVMRKRLKDAGVSLNGVIAKVRFGVHNVYVGVGFVSNSKLEREKTKDLRHQKPLKCRNIKWDGKKPDSFDATGRMMEIYPHEIIEVLGAYPASQGYRGGVVES
jgi:hypothetical protein